LFKRLEVVFIVFPQTKMLTIALFELCCQICRHWGCCQ